MHYLDWRYRGFSGSVNQVILGPNHLIKVKLRR
jgi:hypothetical protein